MAKSIMFGNGNILIGLDKYGQVNDFYFPFVGGENQTNDRFVHKFGVFVDGRMFWIDHPSWEITIDMVPESMGATLLAENKEAQIQLESLDTVYNEKNIFFRSFKLTNLSERAREVKFFYNHQFQLNESIRGDTAYYDPRRETIVHFEGRRIFSVSARSEGRSFDSFSVGLLGIEGKLGTYKDAEDGVLSENPIEHGSVDSVIGYYHNINPNETKEIQLWVCVEREHKAIEALNKYVLEKTPEYLIKTSINFWRAWVNKSEIDFQELDSKLVKLFKSSLLTIKSHVDNNGGIIASGDSDLLKNGRDNYSYVWMRDAGISSMALNLAGDNASVRKFFEFCNEVLNEEGYFMHKYRSDKSIGSSWHAWIKDGNPIYPIQEDESAIVLVALWEHYSKAKDIEFIEVIYNSLIKKIAEFLYNYMDETLVLPRPSYDIWEERYAITTYTTSAVYAGLIAASKFANLLGKHDREAKYRKRAEEIKVSLLKHLYNPITNNFRRSIYRLKEEIIIDDTVDVSSAFGIYRFKVLEPSDPILQSAIQNTIDTLENKDVGGVARYTNDYYFRSSYDYTGNPWLITKLWHAQFLIDSANNLNDLKEVTKIMHWINEQSVGAGMLPEQLNPITKEPLSATPLIWSHAEYVITTLKYLEKYKIINEKI